jgi:hypothetical protein
MTGVLFLVCAALQSCVRPRQKSPRASLSERGGAILSFEPRNMSAVIFITANSSRGHHGSARPGSDGACKSGLKKAPRRLVGAWAGLVWRACQCRNATPGMMCIGCAGRGQRHRAASRHRSTKRPGCVDLVRACPRWHRTTSKLSLPTRGGSGSNEITPYSMAVTPLRRHVNNRPVLISCRSATRFATAPGANASSTIQSLSTGVHCRRRSPRSAREDRSQEAAYEPHTTPRPSSPLAIPFAQPVSSSHPRRERCSSAAGDSLSGALFLFWVAVASGTTADLPACARRRPQASLGFATLT